MHGNIKGDKVSFQKYKTIGQGEGNDFVTTEVDKNGPIIWYTGMLNNDRTEITGEWKFNIQINLLFGFIPIPFRRGVGIWSIKFAGSE
jgi:hypothetical protein